MQASRYFLEWAAEARPQTWRVVCRISTMDDPLLAASGSFKLLQRRRKGKNLNLFRERVTRLARMDDQQLFQFQAFHRAVHGLGGPGGVAVFELEADLPTVPQQEQIEFRAGVGGPEPGLPVVGAAEDLLDAEAFPRGSTLGMTFDGGWRGKA